MFEAVNARLSIPARLLLIDCLFLAPLALLTYLLVAQSATRVNFAE